MQSHEGRRRTREDIKQPHNEESCTHPPHCLTCPSSILQFLFGRRDTWNLRKRHHATPTPLIHQKMSSICTHILFQYLPSICLFFPFPCQSIFDVSRQQRGEARRASAVAVPPTSLTLQTALASRSATTDEEGREEGGGERSGGCVSSDIPLARHHAGPRRCRGPPRRRRSDRRPSSAARCRDGEPTHRHRRTKVAHCSHGRRGGSVVCGWLVRPISPSP